MFFDIFSLIYILTTIRGGTENDRRGCPIQINRMFGLKKNIFYRTIFIFQLTEGVPGRLPWFRP
jgi:hypothetical protein